MFWKVILSVKSPTNLSVSQNIQRAWSLLLTPLQPHLPKHPPVLQSRSANSAIVLLLKCHLLNEIHPQSPCLNHSRLPALLKLFPLCLSTTLKFWKLHNKIIYHFYCIAFLLLDCEFHKSRVLFLFPFIDLF